MIINPKHEARNSKQIQMAKPRRANHKLQTTNHKQIQNTKVQNSKQKQATAKKVCPRITRITRINTKRGRSTDYTDFRRFFPH